MISETQQRALITGASSGIGRETASAFAKADIHVALVARSQAKLEALVAELAPIGVEVKPYVIDLGQIETLQTSLNLLLEDFGAVDILVNNAGIIAPIARLDETEPGAWGQLIDIRPHPTP